jgi:hypothetical protein
MNIARRNQTYLAVVFSIFALMTCVYPWMPVAQTEKPAVAFTTPYQAVVLSNNSVNFGKPSGYETSNPVFTDVYYILSKQDPTTKQVQNVLVKRGRNYTAMTAGISMPTASFFGTGRHRPQGRAAHSGSESAEVASTTTLARPGMRRRVGSSSPLAEILCVETIGMTFHVVH